MEDHRLQDRRIGHRTDRLGVLLDQLDFARQIAQARLGGLASPASLPQGGAAGPEDRRRAFGERRRPPAELVDFSPSAAVALERYWATLDRWRASIAAVTDEQLDTVRYCQYPWSNAAEVPFISVIWASNLELIHHMAEIALLRDLYRTRPASAR